MNHRDNRGFGFPKLRREFWGCFAKDSSVLLVFTGVPLFGETTTEITGKGVGVHCM